MPIIQFKCENGHVSKRSYDPYFAPKVKVIVCEECKEFAVKESVENIGLDTGSVAKET